MQGYAPAQYAIGASYDEGRPGPADYVQALEWYRKAATQDHPPALYGIGVLYALGRGVAKDTRDALKWFLKGAALGDAQAQCNAGDVVASYVWMTRSTAGTDICAERLQSLHTRMSADERDRAEAQLRTSSKK